MPAGCTGGPGPGLVALQVWLCARFGTPRTGPYACRNVRGGTTISLHGLGRAADLPTSALNPTGLARGDALAEWCRAHRSQIGLTEVIWNRKIDTGTGWREYRPGPGGSLHLDHVHVGIDQAAAWSMPLTAARLAAIDSGGPGSAPPASGETPGPPLAPPTGTPVAFGIDGIGDLFGALTSRAWWVRALQVLGGAVLVLAGAAVAFKDLIPLSALKGKIPK